jgi:hypothetical protein
LKSEDTWKLQLYYIHTVNKYLDSLLNILRIFMHAEEDIGTSSRLISRHVYS